MPLQRTLGFWQLSIYGIGTIVGAGIYSVIGAAAGIAGNAVWISFVVSAVVALLAALSYGELASMFPKAGAEYQYIRQAFPRFRMASFIAGYLIALNAAATAATVALAFGGYLQVFFPLPKIIAAFGLLVACTVLNIWGIRQSTWVSVVLICVEVSGLLLMIIGGFGGGEASAVFDRTGLVFEWGAIFPAAALLFFMFIGFEDVANLSEETRTPRKNVPRALVLAVVFTSLIYLLVCFAVLAVASPQLLAESDSPLTAAGRQVAPWLGSTLAVTALFATASTALITLISISRLVFAMAREHELPGALAWLLPARHTPWVAALLLFAGACALLPLGNIRTTASVSALGILLVFAGIHGAVIYLRLTAPARRRPFRVPGAVYKVPVLSVIGLAFAIAFATQFEVKVYGVFAAAVAVGVVLHLIAARGRRSADKYDGRSRQ